MYRLRAMDALMARVEDDSESVREHVQWALAGRSCVEGNWAG